MSRSTLPLLAAVLLAGCPSANPTLILDLRTDFVPGLEVTNVRAEVREVDGTAALEQREIAVPNDTDLIAGFRIFELELAPGRYELDVILLGADGELARRRLGHRQEGSQVVTVLVTRNCAGVTCPGAGDSASATSCLGGQCVSSECSVENPELCPPNQCDRDGDCPLGDACADPVCLEGVCLLRSDASRCDQTEWCDPDRGCRPLEAPDPDAGPPLRDAGGDAGSDAGPPLRDAGGDAGSDAGLGGDSAVTGPCASLCPGTCDGEVCVIAGGVFANCPDGVSCRVECTAPNSCAGGVSCGDGDCSVECGGDSSCAGGIECNNAERCRVNCVGPGSCLAVECQAATRCEVDCVGPDSCLSVDCDDTEECRVDCVGPRSCNAVLCGNGSCDVDCSVSACNLVDCADSCACEVICGDGCFASCRPGCGGIGTTKCTSGAEGCDVCL